MYETVEKIWYQVRFGGVITCSTPGKAINLRQKMYKYRKKLQHRDGFTSYDDLIIRIDPKDCRLFVLKNDEGVVDIVPTVKEQVIEEIGENIVSTKREPII